MAAALVDGRFSTIVVRFSKRNPWIQFDFTPCLLLNSICMMYRWRLFTDIANISGKTRLYLRKLDRVTVSVPNRKFVSVFRLLSRIPGNFFKIWGFRGTWSIVIRAFMIYETTLIFLHQGGHGKIVKFHLLLGDRKFRGDHCTFVFKTCTLRFHCLVKILPQGC